MSKKLTEKMWLDVKKDDEQLTQPEISTDEYVLFTEDILANKNETINSARKKMHDTSNNLTLTIEDNRKWSDPYFKSQIDVIHMCACQIEGEFYSEQKMFESVTEQPIESEELEYVRDLHSQCKQKQQEFGYEIDTCIETPIEARKTYLASIGRSKI